MKKAWKKPVVTVISRGMPEESVLTACKGGPEGSGGGPNNIYTMCYHNYQTGDDCNAMGMS